MLPHPKYCKRQVGGCGKEKKKIRKERKRKRRREVQCFKKIDPWWCLARQVGGLAKISVWTNLAREQFGYLGECQLVEQPVWQAWLGGHPPSLVPIQGLPNRAHWSEWLGISLRERVPRLYGLCLGILPHSLGLGHPFQTIFFLPINSLWILKSPNLYFNYSNTLLTFHFL